MKVDLYNLQSEKIGTTTLPLSYFSATVSPRVLSQYMRVYLSNQRSSGAKVKDRGEVAGTTKKMWAQKGTGRARHSTAKAPLFVGGGSAHGPTGKQNYSLKMNKKASKAALKSVLTTFAKEGRIIVIDKFSPLPPKTKVAWNFIAGLEKAIEKLAKSSKFAIITSRSLPNLNRAFGNIPDINLLSLQSLNAYQVSRQKFLIFSQKAVNRISKP
ncbi:MAG: 50S ribosomal protein L4 [Candidatus Shapirobacteria bacterium]|jgi:large subunit ribosomal protein L4